MRLARVHTTIRRAEPGDAEALTDLRAQMFEAMRTPADQDSTWSSRSAAWFSEHLADGSAAAFVAETESGRLVAAALGRLLQDVPGPTNPHGVSGHVSNVVTAPDHRRRGHARACLRHLLAWFRDETAAARVDLTATSDGERLYESLGFRTRPHPSMRLRVER